MDSSFALVSIGGFIAGWLGREWSIKPPECGACRCECNISGTGSGAPQSWAGGNSLIICLIAIGLVIALSNTALAFKVTYRESDSGQGRELAFDVKGKSKGQFGVFGASKGLQITY